jgi:tetratricopeptide (TPR) repeat protein
MESEILHTLREIKSILYVIGLVISIAMVFKVIELLSSIIKNFKSAIKDVWRNEANEYFDRGEYDLLISHCEKRIETHPNDATAIWWLARTHHANGSIEKAEEYFEKVSELEPSWRESHVEPYLKH